MRLYEITQTINNVLVVVHPGSACGSADFNLGKYEARAAREGLAIEINGWKGGIIVIDGGLSEDLPYYSQLDSAIKGALARAEQKGLPAVRVMGDDDSDYNQVVAIRDVVRNLGLTPSSTQFDITGAWYDPSGRSGCVNSVAEELHRLGFTFLIGDGALELDFFADEDEDDDDEENR